MRVLRVVASPSPPFFWLDFRGCGVLLAGVALPAAAAAGAVFAFLEIVPVAEGTAELRDFMLSDR